MGGPSCIYGTTYGKRNTKVKNPKVLMILLFFMIVPNISQKGYFRCDVDLSPLGNVKSDTHGPTKLLRHLQPEDTLMKW